MAWSTAARSVASIPSTPFNCWRPTPGLSNRALAARLFVTERTVEAHITSIFGKLGLVDEPGVHRRVLAVLTYLRA
jgi:hypothetical protein